MDHQYEVRKYRTNDISSLYIVETDYSFIPGSVAYINGDTSYNKKSRNYSGYIHLEARQAVVEIDQSMIRCGGISILKDAWPINTPGMISISSFTYNIGLNLGNSFKNGFSKENRSSEYEGSVGINIGYSYSKSYTNQEPLLSVQRGSKNEKQYQWSYSYYDARIETFHIRSGFVFEINNSNHGLIGEGQFGLKYNFGMRVERYTHMVKS